MSASSQTNDLKNRIIFTVFILAVYRFGTFVPLPGIDPEQLQIMMSGNQKGLLGMFNVFAGGAVSRMAIFALGIMPYISSSIIVQLLTGVSDYFKNLKAQGETGRAKITQITRYGTVLLATIQGYGLAVGLESSANLVINPGMFFKITTVTTIVAGADAVRDEFSGVWFANYSIGPVSIGYSESYYDDGTAHSETDTVTYRYAGANDNGGIFETDQYSVAFNVNDNLSLSYAKAEDTYDAQSNTTSGTEVADVTMDVKSIQVAYSMGAMSIKAYRTETDNVAYNSLGGSVTVNEIALGLAF